MVSGAGLDGSKALSTFNNGNACGASRPLPHPFVYSAANHNVVWSVKTKFVSVAANGANSYSGAAMDVAGAAGEAVVFGMDNWSATQNLTKIVLAGPHQVTFGDTLIVGHWYEIKLVIDFGPPGGSGTIMYRDITLGQTAFVTDSTIINWPLQMTPVGGNYPMYWTFCRMDNNTGGTIIEDLSMDDPLLGAASIQTQPANASLCPSGTASFSVAATGSGPPTYQWQLETSANTWINATNGGLPYNGATIIASGATTNQLQVFLIAGTPSTRFRCVVSNSCGSVISDPATFALDPNCPCAPSVYNFDALTPGDIVGQDGWVAIPGWNHAQVVVGASSDGSKALSAAGFTSGAARPLPHPFAYTANNHNVVWSVKAKYVAVQSNVECLAVVGFNSTAAETDPQINFGSQMSSATQGSLKATLGGSGFTRVGTEVLTVGHWYEFQLAVDFGPVGGSGTLRYRDITSGQTGFTTNSTLTNVSLGLPSTSGSYTAYWMELAMANVIGSGYMDDFSMDDPSLVAASLQSQPTNALSCPSGTASFSVAATGSGPPTYQWQLETSANTWINATNGGLPYNSGTIIASGVTTNLLGLALDVLPGAPNIRFRCIVSNACGSATSDPATLRICPADFNCDGSLTINDIFDFLASWFAGNPAADFNRINGIGVADIFDFLNAWFVNCP